VPFKNGLNAHVPTKQLAPVRLAKRHVAHRTRAWQLRPFFFTRIGEPRSTGHKESGYCVVVNFTFIQYISCVFMNFRNMQQPVIRRAPRTKAL
jgi:hypothetical protein